MPFRILKQDEKIFLNTIINNMVQGVITVDPEGTIKSFNKRAENIFGYTENEMIGQTVNLLMPFPEQYNDSLSISHYLETNSAPHIGLGREVQGRKKSGDLIPMHLTIVRADFENERLYIGLVYDMTEQRQRENILQTAKEEADKANKAKSDFLANMSHELRTPLNSILGLTRMFLEDPNFNAENLAMAGTIYKSATNLLENVNDILDISKIESGNMELETISFNFKNVINNVIETMTPIVQEKGIFLNHFYLTDHIPLLMGDPFRLNLILTNFLSNAIKYMYDGDVDVFKNGEGDIEVIVDTKPLDNHNLELYCVVNDTGIGIPEDNLETIFDKFVQADLSTTRKFGGTGLGLAITKDLVEKMGGIIGVNSTVGEGSSFWFRIPFPIASSLEEEIHHEDHKERRKRKRDRHETKIPIQSAHILIAEDHLLNQDFIKRLIRKMGFQHVDIVSNGLIAESFYKENHYDLILMDCHMPEQNGYETTKKIRKNEKENSRKIPIIALTADAMKGTKEKCLDAGMDDYISKPIDTDLLKECLSQWIIFITDDNTIKPLQQEPTKHDTPVDISVLKEFAETEDDICYFAEIFLTQSEESIKSLKENCSHGPNPQWVDSAHKLKGGSGMFGAKRLYQICSHAQEMSEATANQRQDIMNDIIAEFNAVKDYLNRYTG